MENIKSSKEVANTVKDNLVNVRGLRLTAVAAILGKSPQSIGNILSGKFRFSRTAAKAFADKFGYSELFLTEGVGELYGEELPGFDKSNRMNTFTAQNKSIDQIVNSLDILISAITTIKNEIQELKTQIK